MNESPRVGCHTEWFKISDWATVVHMVLLQKKQTLKQQEKAPKLWLLKKRRIQGGTILSLGVWSCCSQLVCVLNQNYIQLHVCLWQMALFAERDACQKGQAAQQAGTIACLHGWIFLTPAREVEPVGKRKVCLCLWKVHCFPQLLAWRECCTCVCRAALTWLWRSCAESALLSLLWSTEASAVSYIH